MNDKATTPPNHTRCLVSVGQPRESVAMTRTAWTPTAWTSHQSIRWSRSSKCFSTGSRRVWRLRSLWTRRPAIQVDLINFAENRGLFVRELTSFSQMV